MNLRIREDTAKYLRNLDPNSAPYDPKSRSMKANPNPDLPEQDQQFKGDGFVKMTGDYFKVLDYENQMIQLNRQSEAQGTGSIANTIALPSQFDMIQRQIKQKKEQLKQMKL
mmetsp:Transcript_14550/g.24831  ORF Transcript_14550/g.24831 Transcript_14550/m.24831 type:complete len:112 (+) Transcript_14550:148-483(+)